MAEPGLITNNFTIEHRGSDWTDRAAGLAKDRARGFTVEMALSVGAAFPEGCSSPEQVRALVIDFVVTHGFNRSRSFSVRGGDDTCVLPISFGYRHVFLPLAVDDFQMVRPIEPCKLGSERRPLCSLLEGVHRDEDARFSWEQFCQRLKFNGQHVVYDEWEPLTYLDLLDELDRLGGRLGKFTAASLPSSDPIAVIANDLALGCFEALPEELKARLRLQAGQDDGVSKPLGREQAAGLNPRAPRARSVRLECIEGEDVAGVTLEVVGESSVIRSCADQFWFAACVALVVGSVGA